MKTCTRCASEKPLEAFSRRKGSSDGRHSWCLECKRSYEAVYRVTNPEQEKERRRRWRESLKLQEQQALEEVAKIRNRAE